MPAAILTEPVAGPFTADWQSGLAGGSHATPAGLGVIGQRGIREITRMEGEEIPADLLGMSVIDAVHLGMQKFIEFELEEANLLQVMQMSHPFSTVAAETLQNYLLDEGEVGIPGTFYTDKAGSLLLTPAFAALNSAGAQSTPKRNYGVCTLAPGFEMNKLLAARRRVVPIRLRCYPYLTTTNRYVFYEKEAL